MRINPFKKKQDTKKEKPPKRKEERALSPGTHRIDEAKAEGERQGMIILKPRITEKASFITADGAYTFEIDQRANKIQVKHAVQEIYGVVPRKVRITLTPPKRIMVRNKPGIKSGGKKAIVYLKEGDRIEFV